jgi:hypothetical protein
LNSDSHYNYLGWNGYAIIDRIDNTDGSSQAHPRKLEPKGELSGEPSVSYREIDSQLLYGLFMSDLRSTTNATEIPLMVDVEYYFAKLGRGRPCL